MLSHIPLHLKFLLVLVLAVFVFINSVLFELEFLGRRKATGFSCCLENWNRIETSDIPYEDLHRQWARENVSRRDNLLESQVRLLSAFVYETHISITTTSQHSYGEAVMCRYFDCNRNEIPSTAYSSFFFPMNVANCPRRIGAKYVSISSNLTETPQGPIPLIFRAFPKPMHEISVCVGPMYGDEKKWLEVAEFVEHYKLLGVRHFYFTMFNMNEYSRKMLDEYQRTGEVELTVIQSEYEKVDWQFHLLQINECHQRSKFHSKWVINVDIDERLVMRGNETIQDIVRGYNDSVSEIGFSIQRVQKSGTLPEKYVDDEQLIEEMEFLKYNVSAKTTWAAFKSMYRPDRTAAMYYHWSYARYPGNVVEYVKEDRALIRHYRAVGGTALGSGWVGQGEYANFSIVPIEREFAKQLKKNVLEKVKYVYDRRTIYCEEIPEEAYKEYIKFGHDLFHCKFRNEKTG